MYYKKSSEYRCCCVPPCGVGAPHGRDGSEDLPHDADSLRHTLAIVDDYPSFCNSL